MPKNNKKPWINPDYNPAKSHHLPNGFANRHPMRPNIPNPGPQKSQQKSQQKSMYRWAWEKYVLQKGKPPKGLITGIAPDLDYLHQNQTKTSVTWIGHSTILLQIDGINIITDPQFSKRASPLRMIGPRRHQKPGIALKNLPHIDYILISHNHYDHLDQASLRKLLKQKTGAPRLVVPLGVQHWVKKHFPAAFHDCQVLDWEENFTLAGKTAPIMIEFLAVQHWSARGLSDRSQTLWGSYAVLHPKLRFWFSGDLGYSPETKFIGARHKYFDLAAIAIGAYEPRYMMQHSHINPAEAVQVMQEIGAKRAFGIHWGTFENLTEEPLDQPPKDLAVARDNAGLNSEQFFTMKHGETLKL